MSASPSPAATLLRLGREGQSAAAGLFYRALRHFPASRRGPEDLLTTIDDPWPGSSEAGLAMLEAEMSFCGQSFAFDRPNWAPENAGLPRLDALHGFAWLRDLKALGSDNACLRARTLIESWIEVAKHTPRIWQPEVLGARVAAWLGNIAWLAPSSEDSLRRKMLDSLALQARHLLRVAPLAAEGAPRLTALKGMLHALAALPQGKAGERRRARARALLLATLKEQVLADGGHFERSPAVQLAVLADLVEIRAVFAAARSEMPEFLLNAIDRMAPIVRFFRHGDGGFALFNDSNEGEPAAIDHVLAASDAKGKPPNAAPHVGFHRLTAGRTLVLVDAGAPAAIDRHAHAGTLSFEMSVGKERLVVNCGAALADPSEWRRVQRATAAHSTLSLADTNSSEILDGAAGRWLGRRPRLVETQRDEDNGAVWLTMSHDGYVPLFGLTHQRRLFLDSEGEDLRGEDRLLAKSLRDQLPRFAIRFHLHPRVQVALNQQAGALLRLPSGQGWRFRSAGGALELADSIYLGRSGEMRRAQQLVLRGECQGTETIVKWALQREGSKR